MVNIICMKWGDKFSPYYVNRLFSMVQRNLTLPFNFVCFTENPSGLRKEINIKSLPELNLPSNIPERGWRKLSVFQENFGGLKGKTLFLDLDVVIVSNIDEFFTYPGEFLIAHDKKKPKRLIGNSSVFRFEIGKYPAVLKKFESNFETIRNEVRHEQAYLSREIYNYGDLDFWPDAWVPSYKYHCCPSWIKSWFAKPYIPENAKIIIFHGLPTPQDAINGESGKWYRHIQPATWIENYWKE